MGTFIVCHFDVVLMGTRVCKILSVGMKYIGFSFPNWILFSTFERFLIIYYKYLHTYGGRKTIRLKY